VHQWWRTLDHLEEPPASFKRQIEGFREIFLDAVRIRMRSDIPLACALSGGVDSSSILGAMTHVRLDSSLSDRLAAQPPTAFVASFPETSHDEVSCATEMARYAGISARVLEVFPSVMPNLIDEFVFQCEEVQSPNLGPWLVYREMSRAGIRVTLDGHGGDELLAGYIDHVRFARDNALFPWPHPGRATELTSILRRMQGVGEDRTSTRDLVAAGKRCVELMRSRLVGSRGQGDRGSPSGATRWLRILPLRDSSPNPLDGKLKLSPLTALLFADFHERYIPTILRDYDRYSMAHGVEVRSPFMDWRLVCFCFSLPSESVVGGGFTKRILREAMRGMLPEGIRCRSRKIPFKSPMSEWWRGPLLELVRDTVGSKSFLSSEIWDGPGLRNLVEDSLSQDRFEGALMVFRFIAAHRLMDLFRSARTTHLAAACK
jgi:asparagine synthase (glutamine-hydrolysing)